MNYRKFGNTDLLVSEIGFGTWAIGGAAFVGKIPIGWGPSDDAVSAAAIHKALDAGINFFDTADFYGLGHSEELLGNTLGNRKDVLIASKVGQKVGANNTIEIDYTKEYVIKACDASLKRLKRDHIDFHQLHVARMQHLENGECIEAMQQLQKEGKIRYWGISLITFHPFPEADFFLANQIGQGFQLVFNLINQRALPIIQQAASKGYGIIARMPLQFGLLSGKIKPDTVFTADDHRSYRVVPPITEATLQILKEQVWPLCEKYNTTASGLALSYILSYPEISTVIPGIRTPEHVGLNTDHLVTLEAADKQHLQNLYESHWLPVMEMMEKQG
ncbi:MAG: aldo/keto reductase [Chitinophagaceae bacterium]|nr:aldo/keto reductase [Chitinophagaceae bacterium]MCA6453821.1 aldo/keto reductase [Chitinophagaceae bacterium]MCA6457465.1 aldo/keto reductase [Chitinophagaceae bacterium]MCA6460338.1 aldo/keto reductase [Chitinophagaceae bacterium]MCA6465225.1 aldo/keto reductase [Chitinophagaceae bacterium]